MPIRVCCPHCKAAGTLGDENRGKTIRCPKCKAAFQVGKAAPQGTARPMPAPSPGVQAPRKVPLPRQGQPPQAANAGPGFADLAPPARAAGPRRDADDLADRTRPRKAGRTGLYVLLGVGGLAVVAAGVVGAILFLQDDRPAGREVARQPTRDSAKAPAEKEAPPPRPPDRSPPDTGKEPRDPPPEKTSPPPEKTNPPPEKTPPPDKTPPPEKTAPPDKTPPPDKTTPPPEKTAPPKDPPVKVDPPPPVAWKAYSWDVGNFTAEFPGKTTQTTTRTATGLRAGQVTAGDGRGGTFSVNWRDFGKAPFTQNPQGLLDYVLKPQARFATAKKDVKLGDYVGVEITANKTATGEAKNVTVRAFAVKDRVFQVSVTSAPDVKVPEETLTHFLDSFRVGADPAVATNPKPPPPAAMTPRMKLEKMGVRITTPQDGGVLYYEISFWGSAATDADLKLLADVKPIRSIALAQAHTDAAITEVAALGEVLILYLRNTKVSLAGIKKLAELPKLTELGLFGDVTDEWLKEMPNIPGLRKLAVGSSQVTRKGLASLGSCKELRRLDTDCSFGDADLGALAGCKQLETLVVHNLFLPGNGDGIKQLAGLPNLKDVMLSSIGLKDGNVKVFADLKQVRKLSIGAINLTDAAVPELSRLTWLESLDLFSSGVTKAGGDQLRKALPRCDVKTK